MDLGLVGKTALVAASSKGLGRAIAHSLAAEGARLVMCARNQDELENTADQICAQTGAEVHTVAVDLNTPQGANRFIQEAVERTGSVDILVTNNGGPRLGQFCDFSDDDWLAAFNQLLLSCIRLIREAVPHMQKRTGGKVINVTSIAVKEPIAGLMLSNSLRTAVVGMAKTLSTELAPSGILVNNVCPGRIATERLRNLDEANASQLGLPVEQVRLQNQQRIPLGRYGQPEELAALVTFLASTKASYITGTTILCDGGLFQGIM